MIDWLRRLGAKKPAPLTGAPPVRRRKTYSSQSGYVYQYFYEGHREGEYVFQVSSDRKTYFPVSVILVPEALDSWQRDQSRELNLTERYAVAKIALAQAFDERAKPEQLREPVHVRRADMDLIADTLGLV